MLTFNMPPRTELTEEMLYSEYDILSLTKNSRVHGMLESLEGWHKGSREILKQICHAIGIKFPKECRYPIYQNAFVADSTIYHLYVTEALYPAMQLMEHDERLKVLCWQDSQYYKLKNPGEDFAQRVKMFLGVDYCPLHPFLLERLFSVWINDKGFNVKYI